jgi:hypothetical protein
VRRRELFGWALAGALVTPEAAGAAGPPPGVGAVLEVDRVALFVIGAVISGGTLSPARVGVVRRIQEHEREHVRLLTREAARLGQSAAPAPTDVAEADRRLSALNASGRLAHVRTGDDALRLIYDLESKVIGRCWEALHALSDPALIRTTAAIMASEAQHASAVGGLLHPGKWASVIPVGLVKGKR